MSLLKPLKLRQKRLSKPHASVFQPSELPPLGLVSPPTPASSVLTQAHGERFPMLERRNFN